MAALEVYRTGLDKFPSDVSLLTGMSRIYEALGNITLSAKYYKMVLNVSRVSLSGNYDTLVAKVLVAFLSLTFRTSKI